MSFARSRADVSSALGFIVSSPRAAHRLKKRDSCAAAGPNASKLWIAGRSHTESWLRVLPYTNRSSNKTTAPWSFRCRMTLPSAWFTARIAVCEYHASPVN